MESKYPCPLKPRSFILLVGFGLNGLFTTTTTTLPGLVNLFAVISHFGFFFNTLKKLPQFRKLKTFLGGKPSKRVFPTFGDLNIF